MDTYIDAYKWSFNGTCSPVGNRGRAEGSLSIEIYKEKDGYGYVKIDGKKIWFDECGFEKLIKDEIFGILCTRRHDPWKPVITIEECSIITNDALDIIRGDKITDIKNRTIRIAIDEEYSN